VALVLYWCTDYQACIAQVRSGQGHIPRQVGRCVCQPVQADRGDSREVRGRGEDQDAHQQEWELPGANGLNTSAVIFCNICNIMHHMFGRIHCATRWVAAPEACVATFVGPSPTFARVRGIRDTCSGCGDLAPLRPNFSGIFPRCFAPVLGGGRVVAWMWRSPLGRGGAFYSNLSKYVHYVIYGVMIRDRARRSGGLSPVKIST